MSSLTRVVGSISLVAALASPVFAQSQKEDQNACEDKFSRGREHLVRVGFADSTVWMRDMDKDGKLDYYQTITPEDKVISSYRAFDQLPPFSSNDSAMTYLLRKSPQGLRIQRFYEFYRKKCEKPSV